MTKAQFIAYAAEQLDVCLAWAVYHDSRHENDYAECAMRSAQLIENTLAIAERKSNFDKWYRQQFGKVDVRVYAFPAAPANQLSLF